MTIVPAYGNTFKTKEEVIEGWAEDRDFRVIDGGPAYVNRSGWEQYGNPLDSIYYSYKDVRCHVVVGLLP